MELANGNEDLFDDYFFHNSKIRYKKAYEIYSVVPMYTLIIHSHWKGTITQYG